MEAAPVAYDVSSQGTLAGVSISTPTTQVAAGSVIPLTGTGFTPNQATAIDVGWSDTVVSSRLSYIQYGSGGALFPPLQVVGGGTPGTVLSNLAPNTPYDIRVSECETGSLCTPYGPELTVTTAPSAVPIVFSLDSAAGSPLQTLLPDPLGNVSTSLTLPAATAPGFHTLIASQGAASASTDLYVAGQGAQPVILIFDGGSQISTSTSAGAGLVLLNDSLTVRGYGFPAGDGVAIYLDTPANALAASSVASDGTFASTFTFYPAGVGLGVHAIVAATQQVVPPNSSASANVDVQTTQ